MTDYKDPEQSKEIPEDKNKNSTKTKNMIHKDFKGKNSTHDHHVLHQTIKEPKTKNKP